MEENLLVLKFFLLGIYLGCAYAAISIVRKIADNGIFTVAADILTVMSFAVVSFLYFCAYTDGHVRGFLLLCEAVGFFLLHAAAGRFVNLFLIKLLLRIKGFIKKYIFRQFQKSIRLQILWGMGGFGENA